MADFEDIYTWIISPVTLRDVEAMLDLYSLDEIQFFIITECIAEDFIDDLNPYLLRRARMFLDF
jgi:hypothetical protein